MGDEWVDGRFRDPLEDDLFVYLLSPLPEALFVCVSILLLNMLLAR